MADVQVFSMVPMCNQLPDIDANAQPHAELKIMMLPDTDYGMFKLVLSIIIQYAWLHIPGIVQLIIVLVSAS